MALHILPREEPYWAQALSGLIDTTGQAAGKVGSSYLESKNKKQQAKIERQQKAQSLSQFTGMPYESAYAFVGTPEAYQKDYFERNALDMAPLMRQGAPQQNPMQALQGLGGQQGQPQQQQIPQGGLTMSNMAQSLRPEDPNAFLAQRVLSGAAAGQQQPTQPMRPQQQLSPEKQLQKEISTLVQNYDIDHGIDMSPTNVSGLMRMGMNKQQAKLATEEAHEYGKRMRTEIKAAKGMKGILDEMVEIVDANRASGGKLLRDPKQEAWLKSLEEGHGKNYYKGVYGTIGGGLAGTIGAIGGFLLGGPGGATAGFLGGAHIGKEAGQAYGESVAAGEVGRIKQETTKETQKFEKLSAEFVKGAKAVFGSRITDADLNAFMKMVPTLSNTDEGKIAILRHLEQVNDASLVKGQVYNAIVEKNGGREPHNIETMVDNISEPIIDRMADKLKKDTEALFAKYAKEEEQRKKEPINKVAGPAFQQYTKTFAP